MYSPYAPAFLPSPCVQEHSDLSHSLPLSLSSSVWLRASAERMDALQFVISGPEDTPYR